MKSKLLLIIVFLSSYFAFSQGANLDREYFNVSYVKLPSDPILDATKRTFHSNKSSLKVAGFEEVNDSPSLDIEYYFKGTQDGEVDIQQEKHEDKDKEGNVTRTYYTYKIVSSYTSSSSLRIDNNLDPSKNYNKTLEESSNYSSNDFSSRSKAQQYLDNNRGSIRSKQRSSHQSKLIKRAVSFVNSTYGYVVYNKKDLFWILGKKKHPEYQGHREAYEKAKIIFDKMKYDEPIDDLKTELQPIVEYFDSLIAKYPGKKKKAKKMRYASYYNIAKIYYYMEELDKAIAYSEKLIENDYDKKDGKSIIRNSNTVINQLKTNKVTTRHMKVKTN